MGEDNFPKNFTKKIKVIKFPTLHQRATSLHMSCHVDISKFQIASFFLETVTFLVYIEIFFNYSIDKEKKMILLVQE